MTKGFTLVELLAVIVILAIIALIATPVVLSIIDDAKESAMLRSAEMYLSGVENAVMRENMNSGGNFRPNSCTITNGNMTCDSTNVEVEVDGEVPQDGSTIKFENGKIIEVRLVYKSATIVMDEKNNLVFADDAGDTGGTTENTLATICTKTSGEEKKAGAKYTCEVKEGTSYNFYVLKTPEEGDTTINLIMDRNICEDGTPATAEKTCWVVYNSSGDASGTGPVTAMTYLNNATSSWENIDNLNLTYDDEGTNFTGFALNGKARLPYKSEVAGLNGSNEYLYENLDGSEWYGSGTQPTNNISGIYGYWTLSSSAVSSNRAWSVFFNGYVNGSNVGVADDFDIGVRAVINLKI